MSRCRSCAAEITWAITKTGGRMPIEPNSNGDLAFDATTGAVRHTPGGGWISHFARCAQAGEWRRK